MRNIKPTPPFTGKTGMEEFNQLAMGQIRNEYINTKLKARFIEYLQRRDYSYRAIAVEYFARYKGGKPFESETIPSHFVIDTSECTQRVGMQLCTESEKFLGKR